MGDVFVLRPPPEEADGPVLFGPTERIRDLIPAGDRLKSTDFFGQDRWSLDGLPKLRDKVGSQSSLNFSDAPPRWRNALKHLSLLQMNPALATARAPDSPWAMTWTQAQKVVKPSTLITSLKASCHAIRVLESHNVSVFDEDTWERIPALLVTPDARAGMASTKSLASATGRMRANSLHALWRVTQIMGATHLLGDGEPFNGKKIETLFAQREIVNSVRPDEGAAHVLGFCAWMIDHVADDIVGTIEWWTNARPAEAPNSPTALKYAMRDLLVDIAATSGGMVPASRSWKKELSLAHAAVARLLGEDDASKAHIAGRWAMTQLADQVQLSETYTPCPLVPAIVQTPEGPKQWIDRIMPSVRDIDRWQRYLVYACMYYLSSTLMLRDSQLSLLHIDPLRVEKVTTHDGVEFEKFVLRAHRTKNLDEPVPTEVAVGARVARVIGLMQRLQRALGYEPATAETGDPILFEQRLALPVGRKPNSRSRAGMYLDGNWLDLLKDAAAELHERGVVARNLDDVSINLMQVRISSAHAYASLEHGLAMAAAFGQWGSGRVAAGYVADVFMRLVTPADPSDVDEIIDETVGSLVVRAARSREELSGNGVPRLDASLNREADALANPAPLTPVRLRAMGKRNSNIHEGLVTLCVYQPDGALCGGQAGPNFSKCSPGQCRNSVMSRAQRARYELRRRTLSRVGKVVASGAAKRLQELNPTIAAEFAKHSDDELQNIMKQSYEMWLAGLDGAAE